MNKRKLRTILIILWIIIFFTTIISILIIRDYNGNSRTISINPIEYKEIIIKHQSTLGPCQEENSFNVSIDNHIITVTQNIALYTRNNFTTSLTKHDNTYIIKSPIQRSHILGFTCASLITKFEIKESGKYIITNLQEIKKITIE